jgi:hypothetical protein
VALGRFAQGCETGFLLAANQFVAPLPARLPHCSACGADFRIAEFSRERDAATLPKIWTLFASFRARQRDLWRLHEQSAVVS